MQTWLKYALALTCGCGLPALAQPPIHLLTEDYPPFNMLLANGQITGLSTDIVREMFRRAGVPYRLDLLPWVRGFNTTVIEKQTCLFSTTRTENREHQFKWVGPLVANSWTLYAGPASPAPILSLEGARRYKIGGYSGDAESQYLISLGFNVELTPTDELNPRKLALGRIDFWASSQYRGGYLVAKEKLPQLKPVLTFNTVLLYLACNKGVDDVTIRQLGDALKDMQHDGAITQLQKRYQYQ